MNFFSLVEQISCSPIVPRLSRFAVSLTSDCNYSVLFISLYLCITIPLFKNLIHRTNLVKTVNLAMRYTFF